MNMLQQPQTERCKHFSEFPHYIRSGTTSKWKVKGMVSGCEFAFVAAGDGVLDTCVRNVPGGAKSMHLLLSGGSNGGGLAINLVKLMQPGLQPPVTLTTFDYAISTKDGRVLLQVNNFNNNNLQTMRNRFQTSKDILDNLPDDETYFRVTYLQGQQVDKLNKHLGMLFEAKLFEMRQPVQIKLLTHHHVIFWYNADDYTFDDIPTDIFKLYEVMEQRDKSQIPDFDIYFLTSPRDISFATRQMQAYYDMVGNITETNIHIGPGWGSFASSTLTSDDYRRWDPQLENWQRVPTHVENLQVLRGDEGKLNGEGHDTNLFQILKAQRLFNVLCKGWSAEAETKRTIRFVDNEEKCTSREGIWYLKYNLDCDFVTRPATDFEWNGMSSELSSRSFEFTPLEQLLRIDPFNATVPPEWEVQIPGLNGSVFINISGVSTSLIDAPSGNQTTSKLSVPDSYVDFHFIAGALGAIVAVVFLLMHPLLATQRKRVLQRLGLGSCYSSSDNKAVVVDVERGTSALAKPSWHGMRTRLSASLVSAWGVSAPTDLKTGDAFNPVKKPKLASPAHVPGLAFARYVASVHIVVGHIAQKENYTDYIVPFGTNGYGFSWVPWFLMVSSFILSHGQLAKWHTVLVSHRAEKERNVKPTERRKHKPRAQRPNMNHKPRNQHHRRPSQHKTHNESVSSARPPVPSQSKKPNRMKTNNRHHNHHGPRQTRKDPEDLAVETALRDWGLDNSDVPSRTTQNPLYDLWQTRELKTPNGTLKSARSEASWTSTLKSGATVNTWRSETNGIQQKELDWGNQNSLDGSESIASTNSNSTGYSVSSSPTKQKHSKIQWLKAQPEELEVLQVSAHNELPWYSFLARRVRSVYPVYLMGLLIAAVLDSLDTRRGFTLKYGRGNEALDTIASLTLTQAWIPQVTEDVYQTHCWFLSCIILYWAVHGTLLRFWYTRTSKLILWTLFLMLLVPWIGLVFVPLGLDFLPLDWYTGHKYGRLTTPIDYATVILKYHPVSFFHIYVSGMLVAILAHRYRNSLGDQLDVPPTASSDDHTIVRYSKTVGHFIITHGALIGYIVLFTIFAIDSQLHFYPGWKLSMRLGTLAPFQALILVGLTYNSDPVSKLFSFPILQALGDLSYPQYVFQFIALKIWFAYTGFGFWGVLSGLSVLGEFVQSSFKSPKVSRRRKIAGFLMIPVALGVCVLSFETYGRLARSSAGGNGVVGGAYSTMDYDMQVSICESDRQKLSPLDPSNPDLQEYLINPSLIPMAKDSQHSQLGYRVAARRHAFNETTRAWYSDVVLGYMDKLPENVLELVKSNNSSSRETSARNFQHDFRRLESENADEDSIPNLTFCDIQPLNWEASLAGDYCAAGVLGGPEDPRVISVSEEGPTSISTILTVFVSCTIPNQDLQGRLFRVVHVHNLAQGTSVVRSAQLLVPPRGTTGDREKNWIALPPKLSNGDRYIRNLEPFTVVDGAIGDSTSPTVEFETRNVFVTPALTRMRYFVEGKVNPEGASNVLIHGGANAVPFRAGTLIAAFHSVVGGTYTNFAVELEDTEPFRVIRVSRPLPLVALPQVSTAINPLAFCSSVVVLRNEEGEVTRVGFAYGSSNVQSRLFVMQLDTLEFFFEPIIML